LCELKKLVDEKFCVIVSVMTSHDSHKDGGRAHCVILYSIILEYNPSFTLYIIHQSGNIKNWKNISTKIY